MEVKIDHESAAGWRRGRRFGATTAAAAPLALDEQPVFANQQLEMRALLVGKLEKDFLAFRILEFVAVTFEEAMGSALALDANHQRLTIVDAVGQSRSAAAGKQSVRRPFEEQERRPRLELRILLQQLAIALLERAQMLLLLGRELFEHAPAARVAGQCGGAGIKLQPTPFGRDGNAQRVAGKDQLGRPALDRRRAGRSGTIRTSRESAARFDAR